MAQKTEKEEAEFKVGVVSESSLSLCINNCGFTGTPATKDMCQKCFNATSTTSSSSSISAADILTKFSPEKSVRSTASMLLERSDSASEARCEAAEKVTITRSRTSATVAVVAEKEMKEESTIFCRERTVNRCSGCRRKVGLTGFRCRCGDLFCSEHRYSDRHECSYDYKAAGREAIERENPVVKAAKIIKV